MVNHLRLLFNEGLLLWNVIFPIYIYIYINNFYVFNYWLFWVFIVARGLSLVEESRGYSLLLRSTGSRALEFL